jgi:ureidoglycolate lyase
MGLEQSVMIEAATPLSIAPFGEFIGAHTDMPLFAEWDGARVYGPTPISVESGGEILHACVAAASFPARVSLLERHFHHTQTYLSANGKPFVMVLGEASRDGLPDAGALRAFLFTDGAGVAMRAGIWHEFPLALEDDTRFTVILRAESHVNHMETPEHPWDARGPDLERFDMAGRRGIWLTF